MGNEPPRRCQQRTLWKAESRARMVGTQQGLVEIGWSTAWFSCCTDTVEGDAWRSESETGVSAPARGVDIARPYEDAPGAKGTWWGRKQGGRESGSRCTDGGRAHAAAKRVWCLGIPRPNAAMPLRNSHSRTRQGVTESSGGTPTPLCGHRVAAPSVVWPRTQQWLRGTIDGLTAGPDRWTAACSPARSRWACARRAWAAFGPPRACRQGRRTKCVS